MLSEDTKNYRLLLDLHKWLNMQVRPKQTDNKYAHGYNDAILDVKNEIERLAKSVTIPKIKMTST